MTLIAYGDFTDPLSWMASLRVDALKLSGTAVDWRAVEARPTLSVASAPLDQQARDRIDAVKAWHDTASLPGEPAPKIPTPPKAPWARPAVTAYAESIGAGVADHVRHLLFESLWLDGVDIGSPDILRYLLAGPILRGNSPADVLRTYGYAVAITGGPITTDAWRLMGQWQGEWAALGSPELPVVIEGEQALTGYLATDRLGALVKEAGAEIPTSNPHVLPEFRSPERRGSWARPGRRPTWYAA